MMIEDITRSCSHEKVAQAAVASLGHVFANRVHEAAIAHDLESGEFVAMIVRRFARFADETQRRAVRGAMCGSDQPLLVGLKYILEPSLEERPEPISRPPALELESRPA